MSKTGYFIISVDFESMWGSIGSKNVAGFNERTKQEKELVSRLVDTFQDHHIHSTWAVVGAMTYDSKESLLKELDYDINYKEWGIDILDYVKNTDERYYQKDLVKKVSGLEGVEIASHTFTHSYFSSENVNKNIVSKELAKSKEVLSPYGEVNSIIFPRNEINKNYMSDLKENGFNAYRGKVEKKLKHRYFEFLNCYLPIIKKTTYKKDVITSEDGIYNIPASLFLRFYDQRFKMLESLKLRRIKRAMKKSAKKGLIFHIWFHPHNLGTNLEKNLEILNKIFVYYHALHEKYNYQNLNMNEIYKLSEGGKL